MKVKRMIDLLKNHNPEAEVLLIYKDSYLEQIDYICQTSVDKDQEGNPISSPVFFSRLDD